MPGPGSWALAASLVLGVVLGIVMLPDGLHAGWSSGGGVRRRLTEAMALERMRMRVLVAEDDPGLRSVLERGLREQGYVVDAVIDGTEALSYLRSPTPTRSRCSTGGCRGRAGSRS